MVFPSFFYILLFLPIVVLVYVLIRKLWGASAAQIWVLIASIFFYAKSNPFNLIYLFASILVNWSFARWIERTPAPAKKRLLIVALTLNVLYLCSFKYLGFLASVFAFALPHGFKAPELGFPLGISFFTITQIMYLVDCYEQALSAGTLLDHASFVAFFPYLISGPLGRAKRIRHQYGHFGGEDNDRAILMARGVLLISFGLMKKAVLADSFAQAVKFGNTTAVNPSALESWIFGIAYTMQIYFDFSGYSDIAIGSALLLGIEIPRNFDAPYRALSITEFWQRWHISLTNFITTYLYTPIYRSFKQRTLLSSIIATVIAMGISGLWHGAGWTFIVWGLLHGIFLAINQIWRKNKFPKIPPVLSWLISFSSVVVAFVIFGARNISEGAARVANLFNFHHLFTVQNVTSFSFQIDSFGIRYAALPLFVGVLISIFGPSSEERARDFKPSVTNWAFAVCFTLIAFVVINSFVPAPFVYFKF